MKASRLHAAIGYVGIRAFFFFFESIQVKEKNAGVQGKRRGFWL